MADKKVITGCENFTFRMQEGNGYEQGEVIKLPGLQEVGLELEQDQEKVYADNVSKLILNSGITGATVSGTFMDLTSEERSKLMGVEIRDGMEVYTKDLVPPYVSVSWKLKCNDGSYIHMGATRGNFSIPSSSASTQEDSPEQQDAPELEGQFVSREDGVVFVRVHDKAKDFSEDKFMELIHGTGVTENTENTEEEVPAG
ncbi:hypothetical protein J3T79_13390 [Staphylococcus nepalensis]|uniref:Phage tail protein n=1 Tax=Staphylococcus nepalensis TaxID=214473 RepID=A0ABS3L3V0_9STAP|nr:major tail protein [Staphylococcus nepalensis]MBO1214083.1 hypothetical protein [Staphylococcus nepalensis]MBO1217423.1 hypothetical protein [Staphylococcus nepalensis]MBO1228233.1 hypothetical protein [Staphylococcus nepalensis]MBO1233765.1 hypothetical protein [Staphylococcus nepalensis]